MASYLISIPYSIYRCGVAAYSGYFYQKKFQNSQKRTEEIEFRKDEVYRFNEAVIYLAVSIENIVSQAELVFQNYIAEKDNLLKLRTIQATFVRIPVVSIIPFEIPKAENILAKIPNVGKYQETIQAFHRMRNEMRQFGIVCKERNFLIKRLSSEVSDTHQTRDFTVNKFQEVFQRTSVLLSSCELIFDSALYISKEISNIAKALRLELESEGIKKITINSLEENKLHIKLLNEITLELDSLNDLILKNRFLHHRHQKDFNKKAAQSS